MAAEVAAVDVLRVGDDVNDSVASLLGRFGLEFVRVAAGEEIAGSYWGEPEAGIVGHRLYARADTPLHSVLHEAAHLICMTAERRDALYRDAGGDDLEEAAVCYLQILLADHIAGLGRDRLMRDMDAWGYSFRLGSTARWFAADSADARGWLESARLIGPGGEPRWVLRQ